ncbi:hypothetical protein ACJMK2_021887, partial [Sinanodonta woodiana]
CNFLNGLCSWEEKGSKFPAKVTNVVTEFKPTREESFLTSMFDIDAGEKCLSFKYQMNDCEQERVYIDIYLYDGISWSVFWWSQIQQQMHGWNEINVTINVKDKSYIAIKFIHGNCSNVTYFISSISLRKQSCT